ncbi:hypothetical protein MUN82_00570 [Hymenobacter aerilatus]|uniref:Transmembrane protein n=1 Tax=Hymenobacter aerilatus TaxID=2932251 RepID=A0A8T9T0P9_9BACT|nr:hypothetical protein [Hymenobacter aerilatus]UOR05609.1 hypothetical protein MUN82_00570 [Hymenobacter aerilatus]
MLLNLVLSLLALLSCGGGVVVLAMVLTWQEHAATPDVRWRRLVYLVLPVTVLVAGLMLGSLTLVFRYWTPAAAG